MKRFKNTFVFLLFLSTTVSVNAQTTLKERLEQHVYTLASDSLNGRKAGTVYARMAAEYIIRQWEEIGIEPYDNQSFQQHFNKNKFQNIVGIIRGNDAVLKDEYIVVGAHYDHLGGNSKRNNIYNGADDNASGVATLIELGRALQHNRSNLKRSVILIAFDAEELGLIGSSYYAFCPETPIEQIKLMFSVDMVGWYRKTGMLEYAGAGTIANGNEMILNAQLIPEGLNVVSKKFETGLLTATDTQPFALKKIPTLYVNTGLKSPLHTPNDEAHLIDYDGMTLVTEHLVNLVETISRDPDFESSGKLSKRHKPRERLSYGVSANFGSSHYKTVDLEDKSVAFSFGVGVMSQVNFGCFAIRPEVMLEHTSAIHPDGKIATNHFTTPLSLVLQTPEQFFFAMDLSVGGYYSYCLSGHQGKEKLDFDNTFNRNEGGLIFGFSQSMAPIQFGFNTRIALTNFTQSANADNKHLQKRTMYLTVTYMF